MEYDAMEQYWIWLASAPGITPARFYHLIAEFGDARTVWDNIEDAAHSLPEKLRSGLMQIHSERYFYTLFTKLERMGIQVATRLGALYPPRLTTIADPPPALYMLGGMRLLDERMFAVVGSRSASRDGRRAASEMAEGLARAEVTVVSGMARGVDSYAHQAVVGVGGRTIAVLGCGVDIVYPPENDKLKADILALGGSIISEYPPGMPPLATNFPARNRIISGLCEGVLMVEGRLNSGAMITMNQALTQGREVFAVPGSIYSPLSEGTNQLIFDGATPVRTHWDILEGMRWGGRPADNKVKDIEAELSQEERILVRPLKIEPLSFDELASLSGFNSAKLNSLLTILELRGIIKQLPGRCYRA